MERLTTRHPGYDCRNGRCQHTPKGDHGIHCEEWRLVVKDGDCALSFLLFSGNFPETVEADAVSRLREITQYPYPADLTAHVAFRTDPDDTASPCEYVTGGTCYGCHSTGLGAERLWRDHGRPEAGIEQPESFWRALEAECARRAADYRAERLDEGAEHVPCPRCGGTGKVERRTT